MSASDNAQDDPILAEIDALRQQLDALREKVIMERGQQRESARRKQSEKWRPELLNREEAAKRAGVSVGSLDQGGAGTGHLIRLKLGGRRGGRVCFIGQQIDAHNAAMAINVYCMGECGREIRDKIRQHYPEVCIRERRRPRAG